MASSEGIDVLSTWRATKRAPVTDVTSTHIAVTHGHSLGLAVFMEVHPDDFVHVVDPVLHLTHLNGELNILSSAVEHLLVVVVGGGVWWQCCDGVMCDNR